MPPAKPSVPSPVPSGGEPGDQAATAWLHQLARWAEESLEARELLPVPVDAYPRTVAEEDAVIAHVALAVPGLLRERTAARDRADWAEAELSALQQRVKRASLAWATYGEGAGHVTGCPALKGGVTCDCGLSALRATLIPSSPERKAEP